LDQQNQRRALYLEEIKVRWKKAALESCVPCPAFTCGTSTITDVDENVYNTVSIGTQCWTKENLRVTKYRDGTAIPLDASGDPAGDAPGQTWSGLSTGARTVYAHDNANLTTYGYLYNWFAVAGIITSGGSPSKNICPSGWHVPTDAEWTTLTDFLGVDSVAGGKMKSTGTTLWNAPNTGADNSSGFSALPGGFRYLPGGSFGGVRSDAFFWSATEYDSNNAWNRSLDSISSVAYRNFFLKKLGASVRCLRD
jgi:uncharacterized protein (TIGR02145 family)